MKTNSEHATVSLYPWTELAAVDQVLALCLVDLGGIEAFVKPGQSVVIKPNITADMPSSTGGTTHLELVEALVRQVQRCHPSHIVVAEGTGAFGPTHESAFRNGGWRELAARTGVTLYNLDAGPHIEIALQNPRYPHPLPFSQLVLESDVFITVPCLKTHINADYTVSLKNSFCMIPQWKRSEIHSQYLLEESVVDLNRIRKPDLTVVDGWDGTQGIAGGARFDRPAGARLMLVGADPVAVDTISRELMRQTAPTRYLRWAAEDGLGIADLARIEVRGAPLEQMAHRFMSPNEEIVLRHPELTLHDCGACSGCRALTGSILFRFDNQKMLRPLTMVYGPDGGAFEAEEGTLVVGRCATERSVGGRRVEGCAPRAQDILEAIEAADCFCHQCREIGRAALETLAHGNHSGAFLQHLRVTASGAPMHIGEKVRRDTWHLELLIGDCTSRYARIIRERGAQFGLDAQRDVVWVEGCPPGSEAVNQALRRLQQVFEQRAETEPKEESAPNVV